MFSSPAREQAGRLRYPSSISYFQGRVCVSSTSTPNWLWHLDSQHRLLLSLAVVAITFLLLPHSLQLLTRSIIAWNSGVVCLLTLAWSVIVTAHLRQIQKRAQTQDTNRLLVAVLIVSAACTSLLAVVFLLGTVKGLPPEQIGFHVVLSVVAVICSWLLVHTIFSLHYAHYYYRPGHSTLKEGFAEGLDFPQQKQPDYLDFAYFAFVIGMTCQVSDVQITSRLMRRLALLHGMLSFAFNTVILALSINIISQLL